MFGNRDSPRPRDRGVATVEAAFAMPVFLLLLFAIMEFGLLLRTNVTVSAVSSDAARAASTAGRSGDADFRVLEALGRSTAATTIQYAVVFNAGISNATLPPGCEVTSIPNICNRYTGADIGTQLTDPAGAPTGNFGCGPSAIDTAWCPLDRVSSLAIGPDYVGVYVSVRHDSITGLIGENSELTATSIIRIEPER